MWISVVGRCEIHLGRSRIKPESAVFFGLLLYLGLRPDVRVTREELLELIWPGAPEQARRHSLRQLLYRIRRAEVPLEFDGPEVVLNAAHVHSDIGALFDPDWADGVAVADIPHPRQLFAGYRHSLGAAFSAWVDGARDDACAAIRRACMRHMTEGRREGRWADVEAAARICIATDPLNEAAHMALAEALAMAGGKAEALRVLDTYLWDLGNTKGQAGRDACVLRDRISAQPEFHMLRAGEPPLIGRADELAWLNVRRDSAAAGHSGAALIVGPAGIGKSAIARAFCAYSELKGWRVITVRLRPGDTERPMSALFELIPQLLAASGALGADPKSIDRLRRLIESEDDESHNDTVHRTQEAEVARARVRDAALDLIAAVADESPFILVIEDIHWIDNASLNLISWLADAAGGLPLMWLMTARPDARLEHVRKFVPVDRNPTLSIGPLNPRASAELFRAFLANQQASVLDDAAIHAAAGGNPLYLREIARHLSAAERSGRLPKGLRALMGERIGRLTMRTQRVLEGCAVLGRLATVPRVAQLLELGLLQMLDCVRELDQLGIMSATRAPGMLGLHDLWQEYVLDTMQHGARAVTHLRAGEILADELRSGSSPAIATDAAWHFVESGAPTRAVSLLHDTARHLLRNGFTEDAIATSRRAYDYAQSIGNVATVAQLHLECLFQAGHWRSVLAFARDCGGGLAQGHSDEELLLFEALWRTGSDPEAVHKALLCAESPEAPRMHRLRACLLAVRAAANYLDVDLMSRAKIVTDALCRSTETNTAVELTLSLVIEAEIGDVSQAARIGELLIARERGRTNIDALARALRFACYPYRSLGNFDRALAVAEESFVLAERHQLAEHAAVAADICATINVDLQNYTAAEVWIHRAARWLDKAALTYLDRSHDLTKASLELARHNLPAVLALLTKVTADTRQAMFGREQLSVTNLWCRVCLKERDLTNLETHIRSLGAQLERSRTFARQDSYVYTYVEGLAVLGQKAEARSYKTQYERLWRRDRSTLVWPSVLND